MRFLRFVAVLPLAALLSACDAVVLSPVGDIAKQQRDLLLLCTALMLLIIIPVMIMTVVMAWRYREGHKRPDYAPEWDHSTHLELLIWSAPLLIIICLGAVTWASTHLLDPYRPISRIASGQPVTADTKPLRVDVVALDWKWLFIYPEQGVASLNEMAVPINKPIEFHITSSSVMNAFYIPALAGMIYAMPSMETRLQAAIDKTGTFEGFSANYSGSGFSGMRFKFHSVTDADFANWVSSVKKDGGALDRAAYLNLEKPSENEPVRHYATIDTTLFDAILNLCVEQGKMCQKEMSAIDAKGGLGLASATANVLPLAYDKFARRGAVFGAEPSYIASLCNVPEQAELPVSAPRVQLLDDARLSGAGLKAPYTPSSLLQPALPTLDRTPSNS